MIIHLFLLLPKIYKQQTLHTTSSPFQKMTQNMKKQLVEQLRKICLIIDWKRQVYYIPDKLCQKKYY